MHIGAVDDWRQGGPVYSPEWKRRGEEEVLEEWPLNGFIVDPALGTQHLAAAANCFCHNNGIKKAAHWKFVGDCGRAAGRWAIVRVEITDGAAWGLVPLFQ